MYRYEIKRLVSSDVVVVINRVSCIENLVLSHNEFVWDTEFECGVIV